MGTSKSAGTTWILARGGRTVEWPRFRLAVTSGADAGREVVSQGDECSVGTETGNHLVLADRAVSRHHFTVRAAAEGLLLRDLGTTNGTRVGGVRVREAFLDRETTIEVGTSVLRFQILDEVASEALAREDRFGPVLGKSPQMRRLFAIVERVATSDATVLLEGETGTGKTLIAEAIHDESARAQGPLVVVDCGAIPPHLVESELFGHEKGAFTGAHVERSGAFRAADGGTLFLDEVGELPLELQPKLLRALEQREVKPIGAREPVRVDVRVVAATNRDLREAVNRGTFRADLYYRLNVVRLAVPPLRERPEDIAPLVAHFYGQLTGDEGASVPADLLARCARLPWHGNVRELRNAVERAVLLGDASLWLDPSEDAPPAPATAHSPTSRPGGAGEHPDGAARHPAGAAEHPDLLLPYGVAKERALSRFERDFVTALIARHNGNLSQAGKAARMDRNRLRALLRRYRIPVRIERDP